MPVFLYQNVCNLVISMPIFKRPRAAQKSAPALQRELDDGALERLEPKLARFTKFVFALDGTFRTDVQACALVYNDDLLAGCAIVEGLGTSVVINPTFLDAVPERFLGPIAMHEIAHLKRGDRDNTMRNLKKAAYFFMVAKTVTVYSASALNVFTFGLGIWEHASNLRFLEDSIPGLLAGQAVLASVSYLAASAAIGAFKHAFSFFVASSMRRSEKKADLESARIFGVSANIEMLRFLKGYSRFPRPTLRERLYSDHPTLDSRIRHLGRASNRYDLPR